MHGAYVDCATMSVWEGVEARIVLYICESESYQLLELVVPDIRNDAAT